MEIKGRRLRILGRFLGSKEDPKYLSHGDFQEVHEISPGHVAKKFDDTRYTSEADYRSKPWADRITKMLRAHHDFLKKNVR